MEQGKILIVDDDPLVREALSRILVTVRSYTTDTAGDGLDALEKLKENNYDLIFVDLMMPRMNGMDFLRETRKLYPSAPVVMITAAPTLDNAVNAMKEGAKDFITKPFKVNDVTSTADRLIGERRLLEKMASSNHEESIKKLNAELFSKLQEISILQTIGNELDGLYDNREIYEKIVEMATRLLRVKEACFGIVENGSVKIKKAVGLKEKEVSVAGTFLSNVVDAKKHYIASAGEASPYSGHALTSQLLALPLAMNNEIFGLLCVSNKADGTVFTDDEISLAQTFARKSAQRIENNALYEVFYNNMINTLKALVISIEARDIYTKNHSERVTSYALQIAEAMGLDSEEKDVIRFGGYLHDIGKIGVRDTILLKPGRLSDSEMSEIQLHPMIGANIITPLRFFPKEREIILYHHEKFNGKGYPEGRSGEHIPLNARILAVADTYDAMTSSRPYREALPHETAMEEIRRCSQSQFDGDVVRAFLQTPAGRGGSNGS